MVYIYGEVQRPGAMRLERGMTVMQALATGGGLTLRGTEKGLRVHRKGSDGKVQVISPRWTTRCATATWSTCARACSERSGAQR